MGPSEKELAGKHGEGHAVVIVGNARIRIGNKVTNFFVLQTVKAQDLDAEGMRSYLLTWLMNFGYLWSLINSSL